MPRRMRFQRVRTTPYHFLLILVVILLLSCPPFVGAAHNVTVDDSDTTQIVYSPLGSWRQTPLDPLNMGGRHRVTSNPDATATFTFTGVAIYFYSPEWPFQVYTAISLDGAGPVLLNLTDPDTDVPEEDGAETVQSSIAWFADGLDNVEHTFVISVAPGTDLAIVDGFVYAVPDAGDPIPVTTTDEGTTSSTTASSSSSQSSSTSFLPVPSTITTSATSSSSPTAKKGLSIALGIVCTVFALLVFYGVYWYWRRRQRLLLEQQEEEEFRRNNPSSADTEAPPMGYAYKRQPSTWQRNARGRLVAAPTGITTMIPTAEQDGSLSGPITDVGAGSGTGRGRRKAPRRHGPSPLSMSTSSSSSIVPGSPGSRGKKPLTTIPEMRMREDMDLDALSSASSNTAVTSADPFGDRGAVTGGTKNWTTFDQAGS